MLKQAVIIKSFKWHNRLNWLAGITGLVFILSGLLHPLMIWTGIQPAIFSPPSADMQVQDVEKMSDLLIRHNIRKATQVKLVPDKNRLVMQVTDAPEEARRYFDLSTGEELPDYDREYAIWLARYYSGEQQADIKKVVFHTGFTEAYPWINRLLPVYEIQFDRKDKLTVYIHTELSALANITNHWKTTIQTVFQIIHTWSWLDNAEILRITVITLLLFAFICTIITGICMLLLLKRKSGGQNTRYLHRMAGYIIFLPLLMLSASGLYHLLHYSNNYRERAIALPSPFTINTESLRKKLPSLHGLAPVTINQISLLQGKEGTLYYRIGVTKPENQLLYISRNQKFNGITTNATSLYINAYHKNNTHITDADIVKQAAIEHTEIKKQDILDLKVKHQFDSSYDFRNKRLPVWQVDIATPDKLRLFIDPANKALVDSVSLNQRRESLSFSLLHKWNMLVPFLGREGRDMLLVSLMLLSLATITAGVMLWFRKWKKQ